jgi:hypothetical protein
MARTPVDKPDNLQAPPKPVIQKADGWRSDQVAKEVIVGG